MQELAREFGHPTYTPFVVIMARLLLATIFGAVIGVEREWRNRPAGLRTHIVVCVAAATFAILTIEIVHAPMFIEDSIRFDPLRVVEAVTAGVAFLAAGLVIFKRGEVHGLTTGAGMWMAGAIGLGCGLGLWQIAAFSTLISLFVLGIPHTLENRLELDEQQSSQSQASAKRVRRSARARPRAGRWTRRQAGPPLPSRQNIDMSRRMEELFGDPSFRKFVLQDHKRLPARFFARVSGAPTAGLPRAEGLATGDAGQQLFT